MSFTVKLAAYRRLAIQLHGDQTYGFKPYVYHLDQVLAVALEFEVTSNSALLATRLHDVLEDCDITIEKLQTEQKISDTVMAIVWCVTNEEGKNRKVRAINTYPKIACTQESTIVKLCDRIANTRNCWIELQSQDANKRNKSLLGMYKKEYPGFRKALYDPSCKTGFYNTDIVLKNLWTELDRLMSWESSQVEKDERPAIDLKIYQIPHHIKQTIKGMQPIPY